MHILTDNQLKRIKEQSYQDGQAKGYELGYLVGQNEEADKIILISSKAREDVKEILKQKGF